MYRLISRCLKVRKSFAKIDWNWECIVYVITVKVGHLTKDSMNIYNSAIEWK